jgi:prepilin-type processing-associated H-X9-DG protein
MRLTRRIVGTTDVSLTAVSERWPRPSSEPLIPDISMKASHHPVSEPESTKVTLLQKASVAFSRVDLLVVMGVTTLVILLWMPALARTRVSDHSFQCQNNLRQLVNGWRMYAADKGDKLAGAWAWMQGGLSYDGNPDNTNLVYLRQSLVFPYLQDVSFFKCPADMSLSYGKRGDPRTRSISMNMQIRDFPESGHSDYPRWMIYKKTSDMTDPRPSLLWVFIDENPDSINDAAFAVKMDLAGATAAWQDGPATYHDGACGFAFADGHVETHKWQDARTTTSPAMITTYQHGFSFGQLQPWNPDIQWVEERTCCKGPKYQ